MTCDFPDYLSLMSYTHKHMLLKDLIEDVEESNYVFAEADETTDVACKSQFVIRLRNVKGTKPVERSVKMINVTETGYG